MLLATQAGFLQCNVALCLVAQAVERLFLGEGWDAELDGLKQRVQAGARVRGVCATQTHMHTRVACECTHTQARGRGMPSVWSPGHSMCCPCARTACGV
jgi:hypothetical protein